MADGAALAIGSRYVAGGAHAELAAGTGCSLSRWGNRYVGLVLGLRVRDATAGFRAYRADMLEAIDYQTTSADGYAFQVEMAYRVRRAGGAITEVPITFSDRVRGTSKMSGRIVVEAMLLVTWWGVPRPRAAPRSLTLGRRLREDRRVAARCRACRGSSDSSWYSSSTLTSQMSWAAPKMFSTVSMAVNIEWSWLLYWCIPLRPTGCTLGACSSSHARSTSTLAW